MTAPRVVIDASVMLAAVRARNRSSASCVLLRMASAGEVRAFISDPIVAEYRRKALDAEVLAAAAVADPLGLALDLVAVSESVEPAPIRVVTKDPSDDVYLGTAIAARAAYLLTFDKAHLLPLDPFRGVRIVPPGVLLTILRGK